MIELQQQLADRNLSDPDPPAAFTLPLRHPPARDRSDRRRPRLGAAASAREGHRGGGRQGEGALRRGRRPLPQDAPAPPAGRGDRGARRGQHRGADPAPLARDRPRSRRAGAELEGLGELALGAPDRRPGPLLSDRRARGALRARRWRWPTSASRSGRRRWPTSSPGSSCSSSSSARPRSWPASRTTSSRPRRLQSMADPVAELRSAVEAAADVAARRRRGGRAPRRRSSGRRSPSSATTRPTRRCCWRPRSASSRAGRRRSSPSELGRSLEGTRRAGRGRRARLPQPLPRRRLVPARGRPSSPSRASGSGGRPAPTR